MSSSIRLNCYKVGRLMVSLLDRRFCGNGTSPLPEMPLFSAEDFPFLGSAHDTLRWGGGSAMLIQGLENGGYQLI